MDRRQPEDRRARLRSLAADRDQIARFRRPAQAGRELVAVDSNPIDAIWSERPPLAAGAVEPVHPTVLPARRSPTSDKRPPRLPKARADAVVVTDPQSVAWVFNIRGSDVPYTPVVLAFAILPKTGKPSLFVDSAKLPKMCGPRSMAFATCRVPDELGTRPRETRRANRSRRPRERADAFARCSRCGGQGVDAEPDPCQLPKARKNPPRSKAPAAPTARDGVAVTLLCPGST